MKNIIYFILLSVSISDHCQSQRLKTALESEKAIDCDYFIGFDNFRNLYYQKNNVFVKQSENQTWEYKNVTLGKITSVDIINPLQIVLFYEQFNSVIILDNQLNEIQRINFSDIDTSLIVSKMGLSGQNQFWLYNSISQKLLLYDYIKNNIKELPIPIEHKLKFSQTNFNTFYWIDENNDFFSCDIFGKKTLLSSLPSFEFIQIIDAEKILFSKGEQLFLLNSTTKSIIEIEIVEKSFQNFYYKDQILAIFTNQQIKNFKIKLP
ncbi:hypothetical protein [Flavobacterium dankookense]|uniref:Uncharacterized protein n=1 Tax=Flavobacterium dankookense TaxID=706186 RepID=A0A4R6Q8Z7_9FLAO|nr:hypothetical protein [Flavobacterium dankookense]TDP58615.1 hypothetical protein BC748_1838 [Flavobacterium dankookense]